MASLGFVESLLSAFRPQERVSLTAAFRETLTALRVGPASTSQASENFAGTFVESTTPSTANTEFAVTHQLGEAPHVVVPVLPVDSSGFAIVHLRATRPADASYLYLESADTSAAFRCYVEGP